ncbi:hypothetical protein BD309DRAFT_876091 [Dichomitus squalens]|uniref:Uncharacterized protein n=2 Tax=Dichomitus squalens TaxID=114155 RepID=A0A4Q9PXL6_9APHY|nr:uncharacterized protein DICSQDRAFT_171712 [Dichomitus squalens LYAD-421 SS1]EJF59745.1 hypothetical protein DICSQDRAFT_171712 [Dichomitus squalens LYAD-421 SS1]TBU37613.1 hypothetical protein BD309DRAFT_876091 [Dichomitus squalens]TBU59467.1 hypothetical protein BD310DRAFT_976652 [Dichomitus squalens]
MAACAVCQGRGLSIDPWEEFSASCYPLYMQQFPSPIPNYTAVPGWAYLPITKDEFDVSTAERLAGIHPAENTIPIIVPGPLSSTPAPTSPPFTSSRSMTSTSGISSPTQTQRVQPVSKTNLAAMVAGSVIGGGVFFVGLVLTTFYLLRRRRRALYAEKLDRRRNVILPPDLEAVPSPSAAPATGRKSTATRIMHSVDHTVLTDVASFHAPPIPVNSASSPTSPVKDLLHSVAGILRPTPAEGPPQPSERELDSGWREHPVATLPPAYTED